MADYYCVGEAGGWSSGWASRISRISRGRWRSVWRARRWWRVLGNLGGL